MKDATKNKFAQFFLVIFAVVLLAVAIYPAVKNRGPQVLIPYMATLGGLALLFLVYLLSTQVLTKYRIPEQSKVWNVILIGIALLLISASLTPVVQEHGAQILVSYVKAYSGIIGTVLAFLVAGKLISLLNLSPRALLILIAVLIASIALGLVYGAQGMPALIEFVIGFFTLMIVAAVVVLSFAFLSRMQSSPNGAIALIAGMVLCVSLYYVIQRNEEGWSVLDDFAGGMFFLTFLTLFFLSVFWICDDAMNRGAAWWPFLLVFLFTLGSYYFLGLWGIIPWIMLLALWLLIRPRQKISSKDRWYQDFRA